MDNDKFKKLKKILQDISSVVVAFSGGLDSSVLLKVAHETLGNNVLAVTAVSDVYPGWEIEEAREFARKLGVQHQMIKACQMDSQVFRRNPTDRCYHCKKDLFGALMKIASEESMNAVVDGANVSDLSDYRPGLRATKELGVRSPLLEAGYTKKDVRKLAKDLNLKIWNKVAVACLATRIPYGEEITEDKLKRIAQAEDLLKEMGVPQFRVRSHENIARIEVEPGSFALIMANRDKIVSALKESGFTFVALDLEGYRTGSLNVDVEEKASLTIPDAPSPKSRIKVESLEDIELGDLKGWKPVDPGKDKYVVYIDGCSKGNPGDAAYAFVIFTEGGLELCRGGEYLGKKTNNQAEYDGLLAAVRKCLELDLRNVTVLTDSELLAKQMNGIYKVKNPQLRTQWGQAKQMSNKFAEFKVEHVRREKNKAADKLANVALVLGKK